MAPMIGYAFAGLTTYPLEEQLEAISNLVPSAAIFVDSKVRPKHRREVRRGVFASLRPGDVIVVKHFICLASSLRELMNLLHDLEEKAAHLVVIDLGVDTRGSYGVSYREFFEGMRHAYEMRLRYRSEVTKKGLEQARLRGRIGGRPKRATPELIDRARALLASGEPLSKVAVRLGVGRSTLYDAGLAVRVGVGERTRTPARAPKKVSRPEGRPSR